MTWQAGSEFESFGVTARPEEAGTSVSVVLDRLGTFSVVAASSGITMFLAVLFAAFALYPEAPALGYGGFVAGIGGVLAVARGYWASSTRKARERIGAVMDAIGQSLSQSSTQASGVTTVADTAAPPKRDASVVGDTEATGV
jgi:hypothetical protein